MADATRASTYTHVHARVHTHTYTHIHAYTHTHMHARSHTETNWQIYAHKRCALCSWDVVGHVPGKV